MAGIGFRLKKIITDNRLSSFIKATITGAFVVAGPWLVSIITLSIISIISFSSGSTIVNDFFTILVYIFAFSLILTGGGHYLFTRIFADYVYEDKIKESLFLILLYMVLIAIFTLLGSFIVISFSELSLFLRFNITITAIVINSLWVVLIFTSFLKWYLNILYSYLGGTLITLLILLISPEKDLDSLLIAYNTGNALILGLLILLSIKKYPPRIVANITAIIREYWSKFTFLFFTGFLYYLSMWIDKLLYWFIRGEVSGTIVNLKIYYNYDISMYIANLTIIPGLIYFIINTETDFFINIKKFLISLVNSKYSVIVSKKKRLIIDTKRLVRNQTLSQSILILSISFYSWIIFWDVPVLVVSLWAVFFQLIVYTYINILFYLNQYRDSFLILLFMTIINSALFFIIPQPGVSYLISTGLSSLLCFLRVNYHLERLDRYIYTSNY